jgi:hypothetical protein
MREVIRIPDVTQVEEKPVEFTHTLTLKSGWVRAIMYGPSYFERVLYLGKCNQDGDMFVSYKGNYITIHKGHLNSGKY